MRTALTGYLRGGSLSLAEARHVMRQIEEALAVVEHLLATEGVFKVVEATRLSACDAEFAALSRALSVPLVTEDRALLIISERRDLDGSFPRIDRYPTSVFAACLHCGGHCHLRPNAPPERGRSTAVTGSP